jgi:hypothetical protein
MHGIALMIRDQHECPALAPLDESGLATIAVAWRCAGKASGGNGDLKQLELRVDQPFERQLGTAVARRAGALPPPEALA